MDVKIAFLHGELEEQTVTAQLEGFIDSEKLDCVILLKKSRYGLKQLLRLWYLRFDCFMINHNF